MIRFSISRIEYSSKYAIYKGLSSIKFITEEVANQLFDLGDKAYNNFTDLLYDIKSNTSINSRQLDTLIKIDFFSEFGDINKLLHTTERFNQLYNKKSIKKDKLEELNLSPEILRLFSDKETETHIDEIDISSFMVSRNITQSDLEDCMKTPDKNQVNYKKLFKKYNLTEEDKKPFATKTVYGKFDELHPRQLLNYLEQHEDIPKCKLSERIKYQNDHLGYIEYTNPDMDKKYIVVTQLNTQYSPKFSAYCINNGQTAVLKVHSSRNPKDTKVKVSYRDKPFGDGDILYMKSCQKQPRVKKNSDGNWEEVPGEFNWWLNDYNVVNI